MTAELQRQALARDLSRRLQLASHDEARVLDRVLTVLEQRRHRVGPLDIRDRRNWHTELGEGLLNAVVFCAIETMRAEDESRAELHEAARAEILGLAEFADQPTRIGGPEPYESVDVAIEDLGGEGG